VSTLLLFVDGIGVGEADIERNPFADPAVRRLSPLAGAAPRDGACFRPLDATLGVEGLPQSATGQTTLLTGVNAARVVGGHRTGVPGPSLWPLIRRESLFLKLVAVGARPTFANAYTREHLEAERPRWSATTLTVMAANVPFRMWDDEGLRGAALAHDYTGDWMRGRGFDLPRHDAASAAGVLCRLLEEHELVLYEYFLTDLAAHRGTPEQRREQAQRVEALVDQVVRQADPVRHRVVLVSDHGNLEDTSHRRHTLNPVPLLAWGRDAAEVVDEVDGLDAVTPSLVEIAARDRSSRG
jgi:hypothetical protein